MAAIVKHVCLVENCGKEFSKLSRLTIHTRTHTGERPFICQYEDCFKSYARLQHLKRHEEISHPDTDDKPAESQRPKFRCKRDGCDGTFLSKHSLNRHEHRIHKKDIYKCPANGCGELFKKHQQLKTHYAKHQEENPYRCQEPGCGRSFPFPNKLKLHMKTHEGYKCEEEGCEAKFDKWTLLVKHRIVQHRPAHTCEACGKSFAQKQWLKQHSQVHKEERLMFECPHTQCKREYLSQRNLNAHLKSYHDKQRFPCEEPGCGRTFATKQKQQQHMKLHDPDRPVVKKKKIKKTLAAKLAGIKEYGTDARGESVDEVMTPVDLEPNLELRELHLTSGCHDNNNTEKNKRTDVHDRLGALYPHLVSDNKKSVFNSLCLETSDYNVAKDSGGDLSKNRKLNISLSGESSGHSSNMNQCNDSLLSNTNAKPVMNVNS